MKLLSQTASTSYVAATSWLQGQSPQPVGYIAERIRALNLSDASLSVLIPALDPLKGAWGGGEGYVIDSLDTALVLQALKSTNYPDVTLTYMAIKYLTTSQNTDGGWGFTSEDESDAFFTAHVLSALAQFKSQYIMDQQLKNAATFLLSKQNLDGGFGSDVSTTYETALAFIALIESGQGNPQALQNAVTYLVSTQLANGSWNDDPYSTALALRALALVKPDLAVASTDIVALPFTPTVGDNVTVTATVRNAGLETAGNFTVRLLDNGVAAGEETVAAIAPGGAVPVTFAVTISPYGDHAFSIVVDPGNAIAETIETNNSASLRVWAKTPADLVAMPESMSISPAYPKPGDTITLTAKIANMGENSAGAFDVDLYDGPSGDGIKLGSFAIPGILPGQSAIGTVSLTLTGTGIHTLHLVADPSNAVSESSEENNGAAKEITVSASTGTGITDLILSAGSLAITPPRPASGETVSITLLAGNLSSESATADVEIFDGDPAAGGVLIYRSSLTLSPAETRTITVPWQIPAGIHTLRAYIDRANLVAEQDETNNSQSIAVMSDMVDIEVSASDIGITPDHPMDGDPATVQVVIQNRGIAGTGAFNVNLYNGDPASGGTLLQTFPVADLAGDATQTISYPFSAARGTYRFYAVCDLENGVTELYEDNNLAIRSLLVKTSAEAKGPDLVPLEFDVSGISTDPQNLRISGTATVSFQNKGDDKVATPFRITVFEDKDGDGVYTEGTDPALGYWDYAAPMNPSMVGAVTINLAGTVAFRDAPVYAMLDSGQVVYEQSKDNNAIRNGSACEARPVNPIEPVLKWQWRRNVGSGPMSGAPPMVIGLTDDNGDGKIDGKDTPSVVFLTRGATQARLEVLNGRTGKEIFYVSDPDHRFNEDALIATGDINNDGKPEIFIPAAYFGLISYSNDGHLLWDYTTAAQQWMSNNNHSLDNNAFRTPKIADIDGDGHPVIVSGAAVVNANGSMRSYSAGYIGRGNTTSVVAASAVADLDMDGKQEIVVGNAAINSDGSLKWYNPAAHDGAVAIANFDDDPYPEIVVAAGSNLYQLDHTGSINWGPVNVANWDSVRYEVGSVATLADFDGDGELEIGINGYSSYFILDKNGRLKRRLPIPRQDAVHWLLAATVFDLNGDRRPEIILYSSQFLRIFDGKTGAILYEEQAGAATNDIYISSTKKYQEVIVADVDGDGHAELVVTGQNGTAHQNDTVHWVRVYGAKNNDWQNTRRIWNQAGYHVTNVNDDGTIPRYETPSWLTNNSYHCNVATSTGPNPYLAADLSVSYLRLDMAGYPGSATLTARIGNGGAKAIAPGVRVTAYDGDPANGGIVIGSALTSQTLEPGAFEDVTIIWTAPVEGSHTLNFAVDPEALIPECDRANNTVSLQTVVTAGKPDPSVAAEDIVAAASIPEGSLAEVAVTVRNLGTLQTGNVLVRLYAGNPAAGGRQIGLDYTVPAIAAGSAKTVTFTWDTLGAQGMTYLYALVDPNAATADANRGNNTALKQVAVSPAAKPDLQIAAGDVTVTPAAASEGEIVSVAVNVHNRGAAAGNVKVSLYNGNPATGGKLVQSTTIAQLIPLGGTAQATLSLDSIGLSGNVTWFVRLDPDNVIDESNEGNNQTSGTVTVDSAGLTAGMAADKQSYSANENAVLTLSVAELKTLARTLAYDLQVHDANGAMTATVAAGVPLQIAAGASITVPVTWNTGTTYSGAYTVVAMFKENGRIVARASAPLTIVPVKTAAGAIVVDKVSYNANEAVAITATVIGTSPNYMFTDLSATVTVTGPASANLFTQTKAIPVLSNGQRIEAKSYWNTGTLAPGTYPALLEVKDATGALIATGTSVVTISSVVKPSALLQGSIAVDKQSLLSGEVVNISYSLKNVGNRDLSNIAISVLTVHIGNETVYDRLGNDASLAMGAETAKSGVIDTADYNAKDYLVILRASIDGVEETIAGTYFRVEGAPSAPALAAPAQGTDVEILPVRLVVGNAADPNDDKLSYQFEIYSDSSLSTAVDSGTVSETAGNTAWTSSAALVENRTYFWRARAYDGLLYGPWMAPASFRVNTVNDLPSAPSVSSPMDGSAVASLTPELTVGNSTDPDSADLTYNFEVALDPDFTQIVASAKGIGGGAATTTWTVAVPLHENGTYYWRAQADDWLIEGPWSATARFFVNTANDAPSVPVVIAPVTGSTVASLTTEVLAANSSDPDSPSISYFFEADTAPTFDSGNVVRSAGIAQGSGSTSWQLAGLNDNTRYYLRVKASDGSADSAWSAPTSFFANTANDAPTTPALANPSSGAGVNAFAPLLSVHNASDPDRDALGYQFELYADQALTNLVARAEGITETPLVTGWQVPQSLVENATYYWRSRAFDGTLYSDWMAVASFTVNTANDAPSAPRISAPVEGASVEVSRPPLAVANSTDPDSDNLTYQFEIYADGTLVSASAAVTGSPSGVTIWTPDTPLADNTIYQWRARANDGDSYGPWTSMAAFTVHIPKTSINATVNFDPNTLNKTSKGSWVVVYIEVPQGYQPQDIDIASIRLEGIPAESQPYAIGDYDKDGIADLMVKFKRGELINLLNAGDKVPVQINGKVGSIAFEGVDVIRVIK